MKSIFIAVLLPINLLSFSQRTISDLDHVYPFIDGYALTDMNGYFGVINSKLEIVIPNVMTTINNGDLGPCFVNGICPGVIGDTSVFYDTTGAVVSKSGNPNRYIHRTTSYFIDSLSVNGRRPKLGAGPIGGNIIPYDYRAIFKGLSNHIVAIKKMDGLGYNDEGNWVYQRYTNSVIYSHEGDTIALLSGYVFPFRQANCYFSENDSCCYVLNEQFEINKDLQFISAKVFGRFAWVLTKKGWGLINNQMELVIEPQFHEVNINQYWCAVLKKDKYAFVNKDGEFISDYIYDGDWTDYVGNDTIMSAYTNDSLHILNLCGDKLYPRP